MPDRKPKIFVFPAAYRRAPALVLHTEDEWMHEDHWSGLIERVMADAANPGEERLWRGARRDGLQLADLGNDTGFRMVLQHPKAMTSADAVARLVAFAPEFEWVVQDSDTSARPTIPASGSISVSWREVAPNDEDVLTRYAWTVIATPEMDSEEVEAALEIASANAFELNLPIDPDVGAYRFLWAHRDRQYRLDFSPQSARATYYEVAVWDLGPQTGENPHDEPRPEDPPIGRTMWRAASGEVNYPPDAEALERIIAEVVADAK